MKKILFSLFLLFSFISLVDAKVLNTKVNIDDEGYEKLIGYMSENEMALISQDIYDMFMVKNVVSYESYMSKLLIMNRRLNYLKKLMKDI